MKHLAIFMFFLLALPLSAATLIVPDIDLPKHAEVQAVLVSGMGNTEENAIANALTIAVERVAGTLLTSETYIQNGELIYEQIVRMSASYVVSYKSLHMEHTEAGYRVSIEAQVAKRKLADKLDSLNMDVLEVGDSAKAHSELLASIADYSDNIESIKRSFRRLFGNINSLFTITIKDVHFYTADLKDGKVPVAVVFNVAMDRKKYEARRAEIAKILVNDIGAVETKAITSYSFAMDKEQPFKTWNWRDWNHDLQRDYRLLLMRETGNGYVFDAYDMFNLSADMRDFAFINGVKERQLIDDIWDDHVHVAFKNHDGATIYEDFVIMMTKEYIHAGVRNIPQTGLSIIWESSIPMYDRTFGMLYHREDHKGYLNSMLTCALIYNDDGYCRVFERQSSESPSDTLLIMPFFNFRLEAEGSYFANRLFSDNLTFEYMLNIPLELVDDIKAITIETVDIPQRSLDPQKPN